MAIDASVTVSTTLAPGGKPPPSPYVLVVDSEGRALKCSFTTAAERDQWAAKIRQAIDGGEPDAVETSGGVSPSMGTAAGGAGSGRLASVSEIEVAEDSTPTQEQADAKDVVAPDAPTEGEALGKGDELAGDAGVVDVVDAAAAASSASSEKDPSVPLESPDDQAGASRERSDRKLEETTSADQIATGAEPGDDVASEHDAPDGGGGGQGDADLSDTGGDAPAGGEAQGPVSTERAPSEAMSAHNEAAEPVETSDIGHADAPADREAEVEGVARDERQGSVGESHTGDAAGGSNHESGGDISGEVDGSGEAPHDGAPATDSAGHDEGGTGLLDSDGEPAVPAETAVAAGSGAAAEAPLDSKLSDDTGAEPEGEGEDDAVDDDTASHSSAHSQPGAQQGSAGSHEEVAPTPSHGSAEPAGDEPDGAPAGEHPAGTALGDTAGAAASIGAQSSDSGGIAAFGDTTDEEEEQAPAAEDPGQPLLSAAAGTQPASAATATAATAPAAADAGTSQPSGAAAAQPPADEVTKLTQNPLLAGKGAAAPATEPEAKEAKAGKAADSKPAAARRERRDRQRPAAAKGKDAAAATVACCPPSKECCRKRVTHRCFPCCGAKAAKLKTRMAAAKRVVREKGRDMRRRLRSGNKHDESSSEEEAPDGALGAGGATMDESEPSIYPLNELYRKDPLVAALRLCYLVVFFACLLLIPTWYAAYRVERVDQHALDMNRPIYAGLEGCSLEFSTLSRDSTPYLSVSIGRTHESVKRELPELLQGVLSPLLEATLLGSTLTLEGNNITAYGGEEELSPCTVQLALPTSYAGDVVINGLGIERTLIVTTADDGQSGRVAIAGSVAVDANEVLVRLNSVNVRGGVEILAAKGEVSLANVATDVSVDITRDFAPECVRQPSTTAACSHPGGDIFIATVQNGNIPVLANLTQDTGVICVAAPSLVELASSNATCATPLLVNGTNATAEVDPTLQCNKLVELCANPEPDACAELLPDITVRATTTNGGVYMSMPDGDRPSELYSTIDGGGFKSGVDLDSAGQHALLDLYGWLKEKPNTDAVVTIDLDVARAGKWVFATRDVFVQLEPHWLAAFSADLLRPRQQYIRARLTPAFCPESAFPTGTLASMGVDQAGSIGDRILEIVREGAIDLSATATYVVARAVEGNSKLEYTAKPAGGYSTTEVAISNNPLLFAAVLISLALAAVAAIVASVVLVMLQGLARSAFDDFLTRKERLSNLDVGLRKSRTEDRMADLQKPKTDVKESNEHVWGYFSLMHFGWLYYVPRLYNSLWAFIDAECKVQAKAPQSIAKRLKSWFEEPRRNAPTAEFSTTLSAFNERYEEFCGRGGYAELSIEDQAEKLRKKYGIHFDSEVVPVYLGVRKMQSNDSPPVGLSREKFNGNLTSYFVSSACVLTRVDADVYPVADFQADLAAFAAMNGSMRWQLKRADLDRLGITRKNAYERHVLHGVILKDKADGPEGRDEQMPRKSGSSTLSRLVSTCTRKRMRGWWLLEGALVLVHVLQILLPPVPFIVIGLLVQDVYTTTSFATDTVLTSDTLRFRPWQTTTQHLLDHNVLIFSLFAGFFILTATLDLLAFYLRLPSEHLLDKYTPLLGGKQIGRDLTYADAIHMLKRVPYPVIFRSVFNADAESDSDSDATSSDDEFIPLPGNLAKGSRKWCTRCLKCRDRNKNPTPQGDDGEDPSAIEASRKELLAVLASRRAKTKYRAKTYTALRNDQQLLEFLSRADATNAVEVFNKRGWFVRTVLAFRWMNYRLFPVALFLVAAGYVGYASLVGVWCLLGAVLSPDQFLPYAAAVSTFVVVTVARVRQLLDLRKRGVKMVMDVVKNKLNELIECSPLSNMAGSIDDEILTSVMTGDVDGVMSSVVAAVKDKGSLQDVLESVSATTASLGVDSSMLVAMASGDSSALIEVATKKLELDPVVVQIIVAFARRDKEAIREAAGLAMDKLPAISVVAKELGTKPANVKALLFSLVDLLRADPESRVVHANQFLKSAAVLVPPGVVDPVVMSALVDLASSPSESTLLGVVRVVLDTPTVAAQLPMKIPPACLDIVEQLVELRSESSHHVLQDVGVHEAVIAAVKSSAPQIPAPMFEVLSALAAIVRGDVDVAAEKLEKSAGIPSALTTAVATMSLSQGSSEYRTRSAGAALAKALTLPADEKCVIGALIALRFEPRVDMVDAAVELVEDLEHGRLGAKPSTAVAAADPGSDETDGIGALTPSLSEVGGGGGGGAAVASIESAPDSPSLASFKSTGSVPRGNRATSVARTQLKRMASSRQLANSKASSTGGGDDAGAAEGDVSEISSQHTNLYALAAATRELQLVDMELRVTGLSRDGANRKCAAVREVLRCVKSLSVEAASALANLGRAAFGDITAAAATIAVALPSLSHHTSTKAGKLAALLTCAAPGGASHFLELLGEDDCKLLCTLWDALVKDNKKLDRNRVTLPHVAFLTREAAAAVREEYAARAAAASMAIQLPVIEFAVAEEEREAAAKALDVFKGRLKTGSWRALCIAVAVVIAPGGSVAKNKDRMSTAFWLAHAACAHGASAILRYEVASDTTGTIYGDNVRRKAKPSPSSRRDPKVAAKREAVRRRCEEACVKYVPESEELLSWLIKRSSVPSTENQLHVQVARAVGAPIDGAAAALWLNLTFWEADSATNFRWLRACGVPDEVAGHFAQRIVDTKELIRNGERDLEQFATTLLKDSAVYTFMSNLRAASTVIQRARTDVNSWGVVADSVGDVFGSLVGLQAGDQFGDSEVPPRVKALAQNSVTDLLSASAVLDGRAFSDRVANLCKSLHTLDASFIDGYAGTQRQPGEITRVIKDTLPRMTPLVELMMGDTTVPAKLDTSLPEQLVEAFVAAELVPLSDAEIPQDVAAALVAKGGDTSGSGGSGSAEKVEFDAPGRVAALLDLILARFGKSRLLHEWIERANKPGPRADRSGLRHQRAQRRDLVAAQIGGLLDSLGMLVSSRRYSPGLHTDYMRLLVANKSGHRADFEEALYDVGMKMGIRETRALLGIVLGDARYVDDIVEFAATAGVPSKIALGLVGVASGSVPLLELGAPVLARKLGLVNGQILTALTMTSLGHADATALAPLASALGMNLSLMLGVVSSGRQESLLELLLSSNETFATDLGVPTHLIDAAGSIAKLSHGDFSTVVEVALSIPETTNHAANMIATLVQLANTRNVQVFRRALHTLVSDLADNASELYGRLKAISEKLFVARFEGIADCIFVYEGAMAIALLSERFGMDEADVVEMVLNEFAQALRPAAPAVGSTMVKRLARGQAFVPDASDSRFVIDDSRGASSSRAATAAGSTPEARRHAIVQRLLSWHSAARLQVIISRTGKIKQLLTEYHSPASELKRFAALSEKWSSTCDNRSSDMGDRLEIISFLYDNGVLASAGDYDPARDEADASDAVVEVDGLFLRCVDLSLHALIRLVERFYDTSGAPVMIGEEPAVRQPQDRATVAKSMWLGGNGGDVDAAFFFEDGSAESKDDKEGTGDTEAELKSRFSRERYAALLHVYHMQADNEDGMDSDYEFGAGSDSDSDFSFGVGGGDSSSDDEAAGKKAASASPRKRRGTIDVILDEEDSPALFATDLPSGAGLFAEDIHPVLKRAGIQVTGWTPMEVAQLAKQLGKAGVDYNDYDDSSDEESDGDDASASGVETGSEAGAADGSDHDDEAEKSDADAPGGDDSAAPHAAAAGSDSDADNDDSDEWSSFASDDDSDEDAEEAYFGDEGAFQIRFSLLLKVACAVYMCERRVARRSEEVLRNRTIRGHSDVVSLLMMATSQPLPRSMMQPKIPDAVKRVDGWMVDFGDRKAPSDAVVADEFADDEDDEESGSEYSYGYDSDSSGSDSSDADETVDELEDEASSAVPWLFRRPGEDGPEGLLRMLTRYAVVYTATPEHSFNVSRPEMRKLARVGDPVVYRVEDDVEWHTGIVRSIDDSRREGQSDDVVKVVRLPPVERNWDGGFTADWYHDYDYRTEQTKQYPVTEWHYATPPLDPTIEKWLLAWNTTGQLPGALPVYLLTKRIAEGLDVPPSSADSLWSIALLCKRHCSLAFDTDAVRSALGTPRRVAVARALHRLAHLQPDDRAQVATAPKSMSQLADALGISSFNLARFVRITVGDIQAVDDMATQVMGLSSSEVRLFLARVLPQHAVRFLGGKTAALERELLINAASGQHSSLLRLGAHLFLRDHAAFDVPKAKDDPSKAKGKAAGDKDKAKDKGKAKGKKKPAAGAPGKAKRRKVRKGKPEAKQSDVARESSVAVRYRRFIEKSYDDDLGLTFEGQRMSVSVVEGKQEAFARIERDRARKLRARTLLCLFGLVYGDNEDAGEWSSSFTDNAVPFLCARAGVLGINDALRAVITVISGKKDKAGSGVAYSRSLGLLFSIVGHQWLFVDERTDQTEDERDTMRERVLLDKIQRLESQIVHLRSIFFGVGYVAKGEVVEPILTRSYPVNVFINARRKKEAKEIFDTGDFVSVGGDDEGIKRSPYGLELGTRAAFDARAERERLAKEKRDAEEKAKERARAGRDGDGGGDAAQPAAKKKGDEKVQSEGDPNEVLYCATCSGVIYTVPMDPDGPPVVQGGMEPRRLRIAGYDTSSQRDAVAPAPRVDTLGLTLGGTMGREEERLCYVIAMKLFLRKRKWWGSLPNYEQMGSMPRYEIARMRMMLADVGAELRAASNALEELTAARLAREAAAAAPRVEETGMAALTAAGASLARAGTNVASSLAAGFGPAMHRSKSRSGRRTSHIVREAKQTRSRRLTVTAFEASSLGGGDAGAGADESKGDDEQAASGSSAKRKQREEEDKYAGVLWQQLKHSRNGFRSRLVVAPVLTAVVSVAAASRNKAVDLPRSRVRRGLQALVALVLHDIRNAPPDGDATATAAKPAAAVAHRQATALDMLTRDDTTFLRDTADAVLKLGLLDPVTRMRVENIGKLSIAALMSGALQGHEHERRGQSHCSGEHRALSYIVTFLSTIATSSGGKDSWFERAELDEMIRFLDMHLSDKRSIAAARFVLSLIGSDPRLLLGGGLMRRKRKRAGDDSDDDAASGAASDAASDAESHGSGDGAAATGTVASGASKPDSGGIRVFLPDLLKQMTLSRSAIPRYAERVELGEGEEGLSVISESVQKMITHIVRLAQATTRWRELPSLHPLYSYRSDAKDMVQDLIQRAATGASQAGDAVGSWDVGDIAGTVRTCMAELGVAVDEVGDDAQEAFASVIAFLTGDAVQGISRLASMIASAAGTALDADQVSDWARTVLGGELQEIAKRAPEAVRMLSSSLVADGAMRAKVMALVDLVSELVHSIDTAAVSEVASSRRQAAKALAQLRRLLPDAADDILAVADGMMALARNDLAGLQALASRFGSFKPEQLESVVTLVRRLSSNAPGALAGAKGGGGGAAEDGADGGSKGISALDNVEELFDKFDADGSGTIDFGEFQELLKASGITLSGQRTKTLFAEADVSATQVLSQAEFYSAVQLLKEELSKDAIHALGFSRRVIIVSLATTCLILALTFTFLFLGIQALSAGSSFGAVVNSILPMAAGGGVLGGGAASGEEEPTKRIKHAVERAVEKFSPSV